MQAGGTGSQSRAHAGSNTCHSLVWAMMGTPALIIMRMKVRRTAWAVVLNGCPAASVMPAQAMACCSSLEIMPLPMRCPFRLQAGAW